MSAASNEPCMKLQIVVDKKKKRVMFAEAKKEFVDFIFHILSFPLGAVHSILTEEASDSFGSIGTLYDGFDNLDDEYMEDLAKYNLYCLKAPYWGKNTTLLLPQASLSEPIKFYQCSKDQTVYVDRLCSHKFPGACLTEVKLADSEWDIAVFLGNENGYVKELVMFMVMDDLVVRPAEPSSVFFMMKEHSIQDVGNIEKREVTFGEAEAIMLLKASISSKTVLTDVFLHGAVKTEN